MSKFDERIEAFNGARAAEVAMKWFNENSDNFNAIQSTATVTWGSATNEGKAAEPYINAAVKLLHREIVALTRKSAEQDLKRGEELL